MSTHVDGADARRVMPPAAFAHQRARLQSNCCDSLYVLLKRAYRRQYRLVLVTLMALSVLMTGYWWIELKDYMPPLKQSVNLWIHRNALIKSIEQEKNIECQMPDLDPFSNEAMAYHRDVPKLICKGNDWVECYFHECYVKDEILKTMKDIVCTYRDILYINDSKYEIGEPTKVVGTDKYYLRRSDLVKISCIGKEIKGMGLLSSRWFGNKAGLRHLSILPVKNRINVMILGFDSASRNGFIRKMPKSYKYLKEDLKAVILESYNIVGDGTPYAVYPIMSGKLDMELPDTRISIGSNLTVDPEFFLFKDLQKEGYRTAYFEDSPRTGTFNYRYNGFPTQPADHYLRPLFLENTNEVTWWFGVENDFCIGSVPHYEFMMNLTKQIFEHAGNKFVFTFIGDISHDDFNYISWSDEATKDFLSSMSEHLANTMIFVMGDHGVRFGSYRNTYQGKIEERLPFMAIILPDELIARRPEALKNLKDNVNVLTTPFDIHTTILDALDLLEKANPYVVPGSDLPRGMSLLKPIPRTRTCGKAAVVPYYCACTKWYNISSTNPIFKRVAKTLADYINKLTEEKRSLCVIRRLVATEWVQRQSLTQEILIDIQSKQENNEFYQAKIIMNPGEAIYEGSVKYSSTTDTFSVSTEDISRVNAYGMEPACVSATYPHLNKYCYCKVNIIDSKVV